ncbi:MAG: hypothetical protein AAF610_00570 [Pseudomonadota bacterium]
MNNRINLRICLPLMGLAIALTQSGCASAPLSVCETMLKDSRAKIKRMHKSTERADFERHLVLLETGTVMSSQCRSYFIDAEDYANLPGSLRDKCVGQSTSDEGGYCTLFYLDGETPRIRVY